MKKRIILGIACGAVGLAMLAHGQTVPHPTGADLSSVLTLLETVLAPAIDNNPTGALATVLDFLQQLIDGGIVP